MAMTSWSIEWANATEGERQAANAEANRAAGLLSDADYRDRMGEANAISTGQPYDKPRRWVPNPAFDPNKPADPSNPRYIDEPATAGTGGAGGGTGGGGPVPGSSGGTAEQRDAMALLRGVLDEWGLGSLADWAWKMMTSGASSAQVMLELRKQQAFKDRFPYLDALAKQGRAISPAQGIAMEREFLSLGHSYFGESAPTIVSMDRMSKWISGNVSLGEVKERFDLWKADFYDSDPAVLAELRRRIPNEGDLLAAYVSDEALPAVRAKHDAARIGASAVRTGYGSLSLDEADSLRRSGVTEGEAQQGFGELAQAKELFGVLPGEVGTEVTRSEQMDARFRNASGAQERIRRRREQRLAASNKGGRIAGNERGLVGLGSART